MKNNEIIKKIIITKTKIFYSKLIYMHTFQDLDLKILRKICSKYNLHVKIAKYSKLSKEQLIPHMEKHLHITDQGKIKMREAKYDEVNNELSKMIEDLKMKVKEVKEKVKKQQTKKMMPKEDKAVKVMENIKKAEEKAEVKAVEKMKENLGVKPPAMVKEKKMKKVKPMKEKPMKEEKDEDEYSKEEKKAMMERIEKLKVDEVIKEGLTGNMKTMSKKDFINLIKEWEADQTPRQRRPRGGQEMKKETPKEDFDDIVKEYIKLYEDKSDNVKLNKYARIIKARSSYGFDDKGFLSQIYNFYKKKETPKEDQMKEYKEAKQKKLSIVEKVDSLQSELEKLEKMIKIDEKRNEMEHKQIKEEIKEEIPKTRDEMFDEEDEEKYIKDRQAYLKREVEKPLENIKYYTDDNYAMWKKDKKEEKERYIRDIIRFKFQKYIKDCPVIYNYYKKYIKDNNIDEAKEDDIYEGAKEHYYNSGVSLEEVRKDAIKNYKKEDEIHEPQYKMKSREDDKMDFRTEPPKRTKRQSGEVIDFSKRVIRD